MPVAFLLAMQAAGMVIDWYGTNQQKQLSRLGTQIEQAGIESQIQMTRLEAEEASLAAMKKLRQTMGSQAAVFAARGTFGGAGSALALTTQSMTDFSSDERIRKINQQAKEANLRANSTMAGLHQLTYETQLGQAMRQRFFDKLPLSTLGGGDSGSGIFGKGGGSTGSAGAGAGRSFGMAQFTG